MLENGLPIYYLNQKSKERLAFFSPTKSLALIFPKNSKTMF